MMKNALRVLIGLALLLAFGSPVAAQDGPGNPEPLSAQTIPCPMTLPEGDIDGETMICGQIEVPENWDNPSERTLVISYAIAKAHNEAPFSDPIMFFEGGPGISALEEIEILDDNTDHLRMTRDIIFFDQRGIRYSSALECPPEIKYAPYEYELPEDADIEEITAIMENPNLDADPEAMLRVAEQVGPEGEIVNCAPYFEEQGIDLSQYGSYSNALDSIALMNALDYPSYNLYGISYGSNHTMEVMRYYDENDLPDLPTIRSILIDGVIGSWIPLRINNALGRPVVVLSVFEACEADDACATSYPNIRQRAIDLLAAIEAEPLVIDESTTITVDDLRAVLTNNAADVEARVYLPRMIDELEQGDADVYLRLQDGTLPVDSETLPDARNPFDSITLEANDLATQTRIIADEIETLAALSQRLSEASSSGMPLPQFFADELATSAEQLPSAALQEISIFFGAVPGSSPDRNDLLEAVSLLPSAEANLLAGMISLMDDGEIAEVYTILSDPIYSERFLGVFKIPQTVIHCNDRVFDLVDDIETLRAYEVPQLIGTIDFRSQVDCTGYGLDVNGPMLDIITNSSGFPVFISNGTLDALTPLIWGEQIYEGMENARMITFPNSGHGATRETECSRDIANAFFMYPEAELDLSCVETLRPVFVLPDDELPE